MEISCPSCKHPLSLPDSLVGKLARCPGCKQNFVVPAGQSRVAAVEDDLMVEGSVAAQEVAQPPPDISTLQYCPSCGAKWKKGRVDCKSCHYNAGLDAVLKPRERRRMNMSFDIQKVFLIVFLVAAAYGVYWMVANWNSIIHGGNTLWEDAARAKIEPGR